MKKNEFFKKNGLSTGILFSRNRLKPIFKRYLASRIMLFKTSASILREAKMRWKALTLSGRINSHFLFYTALAKNIVPFTLINPPLILLPIIIKENNGKIIKIQSADELFERGEI